MLSGMKNSATKSTSDNRHDAGLWLKGLRESQGMSQRNLADKLDLDYYTFISQLENGRGKIPASRYRSWADALGIDVQVFVKELLFYYDPITYEILFKDQDKSA